MRTKYLHPEERCHCENCKFLRYGNNYTKDKVFCKLGKDSGMELTYQYPSDEFEEAGKLAEDCLLFQ